MTNGEVAVVGAGVVGSAIALALARRGVSVALLEAEAEPGLAASGTNSGILHTGFDSPPGDLETELILRAAALRELLLEPLGVPVIRCGAILCPRVAGQREAIGALADRAGVNAVATELREDGSLWIPGEMVTDPVAYTRALAAAAQRHGAELRSGFRVTAIEDVPGGSALIAESGEHVVCSVIVNCAGLFADEVERAAGVDRLKIHPRKGEFLVFDPPGGEHLERILLPVPTARTKGVLVFPTIDGKVVAGPTAVDQEDKQDWSVRPAAREEILPKAAAMYPALEGGEPVAAYAGLRTASRQGNYLIGPPTGPPPAINARLVSVAAIRSTGMSASLGIAEHVCEMIGRMGVELGPEAALIGEEAPTPTGPWWRRAAEYRGLTPERAGA